MQIGNDMRQHLKNVKKNISVLKFSLKQCPQAYGIRHPVYDILQKYMYLIINEGVHMYTDTAYGYGVRIGYSYFDRSMSQQKMTSEMAMLLGNTSPSTWD